MFESILYWDTSESADWLPWRANTLDVMFLLFMVTKL